MAAYGKQLAKFLVNLPRGPLDNLTTLFEELRLDVAALPMWAQPCNRWISAPTWVLINKRAALRQQGKLLQQAFCLIGRQIFAGLKGDHAKQAVVAVEKIKGQLAAGEPKEAWQSLKGWHKAAINHTPRLSKMSLAAQTAKCSALYGRVALKGDPIPIHVNKANIQDNILSDKELQEVMRALQNRCAAGATGLQSEHMMVWLSDTVHKEEEEKDIGLGYKWGIFVKMMQAIWEYGSIPKQMRWEIIILLPIGGSDYCGIRFLVS
jgi:hypothetical protein